MSTQPHTLKISKKGQITLPRYMRDALGSERVRVTLINKHIRLEAVKSVAGSLSGYAKPSIEPEDETHAAWDAAIKDKHASH